MLAKMAARNHFPPGKLESSKNKIYTIGPIGETVQAKFGWIFENFKLLAFHCHRSNCAVACVLSLITDIVACAVKETRRLRRLRSHGGGRGGGGGGWLGGWHEIRGRGVAWCVMADARTSKFNGYFDGIHEAIQSRGIIGKNSKETQRERRE